MTREETIKSALKFLVLKQTEQGSWGYSDRNDNEISWDKVLEWIDQQPYGNLISRQAAIDAFEKFIHELGIKDEPYNYGEMALSAQNVPSIEPERCRDCISRRAIIDKCEDTAKATSESGEINTGFIMALDFIADYAKHLPSVEPEKCGDCVSRKCVNDLIDKWTFKHFIEDGEYVGENPVTVNFINADILQKDINSLPSVEPDKFILQNLDRFSDNEDTRDK